MRVAQRAQREPNGLSGGYVLGAEGDEALNYPRKHEILLSMLFLRGTGMLKTQQKGAPLYKRPQSE